MLIRACPERRRDERFVVQLRRSREFPWFGEERLVGEGEVEEWMMEKRERMGERECVCVFTYILRPTASSTSSSVSG